MRAYEKLVTIHFMRRLKGGFMQKINISQLLAAVQNAPAFAAPEMSSGTSYLFNNVYKRLSGGESVCISVLDFDAFDSEDIGFLRELYNNIYEDHNHKTCVVVNSLQVITPISKDSVYV